MGGKSIRLRRKSSAKARESTREYRARRRQVWRPGVSPVSRTRTAHPPRRGPRGRARRCAALSREPGSRSRALAGGPSGQVKVHASVTGLGHVQHEEAHCREPPRDAHDVSTASTSPLRLMCHGMAHIHAVTARVLGVRVESTRRKEIGMPVLKRGADRRPVRCSPEAVDRGEAARGHGHHRGRERAARDVVRRRGSAQRPLALRGEPAHHCRLEEPCRGATGGEAVREARRLADQRPRITDGTRRSGSLR
jgi:hypothetical protein